MTNKSIKREGNKLNFGETLLCVLFVVAGVLLGCDQSSLRTFPVTGKITYQGELVEGAEIGFVPQGDPHVKPARGTSGEDGQYRLNVYVTPDNQPKGAMAGYYKVTVQKVVTPKLDRDVEYHERIMNPQLMPKNLLPEIYSQVDSTPFSATVTTDGTNEFDFTLEDDHSSPAG